MREREIQVKSLPASVRTRDGAGRDLNFKKHFSS
jgi:hypothetical protein